MARGKQTCKILKEIRRQIAAANDIEFTTSECRYKGDCLGTCPKCEAEVRYLEEQLRARSEANKHVVLVGVSSEMSDILGSSNTIPRNFETSREDFDEDGSEFGCVLDDIIEKPKLSTYFKRIMVRIFGKSKEDYGFDNDRKLMGEIRTPISYHFFNRLISRFFGTSKDNFGLDDDDDDIELDGDVE